MRNIIKVILQIKTAFAQDCPVEPCLPKIGPTSFLDFLTKVFNFLFEISLIIAPIIIVYGGLQMVFAAGNEEKIRGARKTITYTLIGLAIIIIGKGLVFLLQEILTLP